MEVVNDIKEKMCMVAQDYFLDVITKIMLSIINDYFIFLRFFYFYRLKERVNLQRKNVYMNYQMVLL